MFNMTQAVAKWRSITNLRPVFSYVDKLAPLRKQAFFRTWRHHERASVVGGAWTKKESPPIGKLHGPDRYGRGSPLMFYKKQTDQTRGKHSFPSLLTFVQSSWRWHWFNTCWRFDVVARLYFTVPTYTAGRSRLQMFPERLTKLRSKFGYFKSG